MKRILISAVLALALAGTGAFASQNKNAKKPAAKPSNSAGMSNTGTMKKKHRRHKKRSAKKGNANMGGGMTKKKGNSNK